MPFPLARFLLRIVQCWTLTPANAVAIVHVEFQCRLYAICFSPQDADAS